MVWRQTVDQTTNWTRGREGGLEGVPELVFGLVWQQRLNESTLTADEITKRAKRGARKTAVQMRRRETKEREKCCRTAGGRFSFN